MEKNDRKYDAYLAILHSELIPATGCTEPIAIAFAAAKAKEVLGDMPDRIVAEVSGSILKNAKSVVVPNTDQQKGIRAAIAAGIIAGDPVKNLEVISDIDEAARKAICQWSEACDVDIRITQGACLFEIVVRAYRGDSRAVVHIADAHTNIVYMEKDGEVLFRAETASPAEAAKSDYDLLTVQDIVEFATLVDISRVRDVIGRQIASNSAMADMGMREECGANIGQIVRDVYGDDIRVRARARAAAASDARMNGCKLPVIIVAGSGNQGLTTSIPVIEYGREMGVSEETLCRALVLSNLLTIHQKTGIGKLSAYCGAVSAGASCGAGIAYLHGGGFTEIAHTLVNTLAILSGMICDGAKPSCAAKISAAVEAGIMGFEMYQHGRREFVAGEGIVAENVERTIANVGRLSRDGMRETDREILRMMME